MPNKSIAKQKHENDKVVNFLSCSSTVWPPPHCVLHLNESVCCISKWCKRKSWGEEGLQIVGKLGLDPRPLSVTLTILLVCPIPSISYTFAQLILWDISRALPPVSPLPDIFHSCNSHHAYIYIESFTYLIQTLIALPSLHSPCILPEIFCHTHSKTSCKSLHSLTTQIKTYMRTHSQTHRKSSHPSTTCCVWLTFSHHYQKK